MSWLNANEYALMEVTVRERVDELHATVDQGVTLSTSSDDPAPQARVFGQCPFRPRALASGLPG
jgi:hypothetical protein